MPVETIPDTSIRYFLVSLDAKGNEREEGAAGLLSDQIREYLRNEPVTDVFLVSHGWKGDIPAAREQYNQWVGAMLRCPTDIARVRDAHPSFRPLVVGLHWPSLPFGDETITAGAIAFDLSSRIPPADQISFYAERIAGSSAALHALNTIFEYASHEIAPRRLAPEVADAYRILDAESGLRAQGPAAPPGEDREPFDPERGYQLAL